MPEERIETNEGAGADTEARPRILVLTSDALFPHFFPAHVLARLEEVGEWERYNGREDSAELRAHLSRSDALMNDLALALPADGDARAACVACVSSRTAAAS